jgi:ABC-type nickel/cobalt efflux system permease component RcnA
MIEYYNYFLKEITLLQFKFNQLVSANIRNIDSDDSILAIMIVLGISLIYGIVHALGPGHGKAIVAFYFLQNNSSKKEAFKLGYLISIVHSISALSVTFVIYFLIDTIFSRTFRLTSGYAMQISAVMIICVGIYLVYESFKERNKKDSFENSDQKSKYAVAISAGIVPCPGVMTITLFSVSLGHYALGVASAIIMSIGMGFSISLAGILAVVFRDKISAFSSKKLFFLQLLSSIFIIIIGLLLYNSAH